MAEATNGTVFRSIGTKDKLVDRVVGEIQRLIFVGQLVPGSRLPPERELADQIGVSRTVLREAVRTLVSKGLLETQHGIGTLVRQPDRDQFAGPLGMLVLSGGVTLDQIHQVRSILELEIAALAAHQAGQEDIEALRRAVTAMALTGDTQEFADLDAGFHSTLARVSHNPLLVVLLDSIRDVMQQVRMHVSGHPALRETVIPDHREILDAVVARDAQRARAAMEAHLAHARKIQEEYLEDRDIASLVSSGS